MPGRIKPSHDHADSHTHQNLKPRPHLSHVRRETPLEQQPNQDDPNAGTSLFENQNKGFVLNKQTIIWLVVVSVIVLATLVIVTCLLCKCKRRLQGGKGGDGVGSVKRHRDGSRWYPSLEVRDGRNEFQAWNRRASPRPCLAEKGTLWPEGETVRMETWKTGDSVTSLVRLGAVRVSGANGSAVMEPVVVDCAVEGCGKKNSRYYSNLSSGRGSLWKRISQIGRAY